MAEAFTGVREAKGTGWEAKAGGYLKRLKDEAKLLFKTKNGPLVKWPKTPASHAGNMGSNPVRVTSVRRGTQRGKRVRQSETAKSCFK